MLLGEDIATLVVQRQLGIFGSATADDANTRAAMNAASSGRRSLKAPPSDTALGIDEQDAIIPLSSWGRM
ncbi:hypothetical protein I551_5421 [Mycobacterium ulcerans str. Harvey]|uniref:Uncharacterized protein n=1 Tax=Mycobacterium ulcerans str. Harvey TaxID=1299332 RepID=A0ABP3AF24_MYCUL|nr:hypothetical protein I551_5421 [Mycobacterium ulcerans str. Harvey]